ncbi:hypothetical protein H2203_008582 [Taxawa tesnikishii (nom. ined.)]|nr:hypothetical protein H2203_008582 [Dothideales sp. JES 119]
MQTTISNKINFRRGLTGAQANTTNAWLQHSKKTAVWIAEQNGADPKKYRNMTKIKEHDERKPDAEKWLLSEQDKRTNHWPPYSEDGVDRDVSLLEMAAGVVRFPTGDDRGVLTRCVEYADSTQDPTLMLFQVKTIAERRGFTSSW